MRSQWVDTKQVRAMAYDSQNAGYNTFNTVSVRLWSALPIFGNDYRKNTTDIINQLSQAQGRHQDQYKNIIEARKECEKITCAPYPVDTHNTLDVCGRTFAHRANAATSAAPN